MAWQEMEGQRPQNLRKSAAHCNEYEKMQEYKRKLAAGELTEDDYDCCLWIQIAHSGKSTLQLALAVICSS